MLPEREPLAAVPDPGGPAEIIHRRRMDARLGEPDGQRSVERMEASDVGKDHDAGCDGIGRACAERGEAVAVGGRQHHVVRAADPRAACDRWRRRLSGWTEAHLELPFFFALSRPPAS
jgi:hypothetical protein